jgi:hypothetical protein
LLGKFIFSVTSLNSSKSGQEGGGSADDPQQGGGELPPLPK